MRKLRSIVPTVIIFCLAFSVAASARVMDAERVPIWVENTSLPVEGRLVDGTTMVPLYEFAAAMEMVAGEDPAAGKVTISRGERSITFYTDRMNAVCGDHELQVIPGAASEDSSVYLPLRFTAENLGFLVRWDSVARAVSLLEIEENPIKIATAKDVDRIGNLVVNIQYPVIEGLENKDVEAAFNAHFEGLARECRERGIKNRKVLDDEGWVDKETAAWFNYRIAYNMNDLVSVVTTDYEYTGGAHGMTVQGSYTINLNTGKAYSMSDIFLEDADYISLVSGEVDKQIKDWGPDIHLLRPFEGIGPDQEFYLEDDCLVVYFQLYEYTPYAVGIQEFPISLILLEESLDPGFRALIAGPVAEPPSS